MRSAVAAAAFAGIATAAWAPQQGGWGSSDSWGETTTSAAPVVSSAPAQYTTDVVTAYTTYCPEATEITHGGQTYTATEATTLTITNCPGGCTITYPQTSSVAPVTSVVPTTYSTVPAPVSSAPASSAPAPYPAANSTTVYSTAAPVGSTATGSYGATGSPIPSAPPATGGAAQTYTSAGAAILAIFGLVAAL